jgi:hypothetical protein
LGHLPGLVNVYITMENHHAINGKTHYFDWAIFDSFLYVYQRVYHSHVFHNQLRVVTTGTENSSAGSDRSHLSFIGTKDITRQRSNLGDRSRLVPL